MVEYFCMRRKLFLFFACSNGTSEGRNIQFTPKQSLYTERIFNKVVIVFNEILQGERACIKGLEYIFLKILD